MTQRCWSSAWRFAIFATVCLVAMFAMVVVFGQIRFGSEPVYRAEFTSVTGLKEGNFVRIAGVEVGKVKKISISDNVTAVVDFTADSSVVLTEGSRAAVRYQNLTGDRYMALEEGAGGVKVLRPGQTIPLSQTDPALDIDALIGGFRPLFRALNPHLVNQLTADLVRAFQGEGDTVGSILRETAAFTSTLADRDQVIDDLIANLNTVVGSLSAQSTQFDKTLRSLSSLVDSLAAHKDSVSDALASVNAASGTIADLLVRGRPPLKKAIHETDRTATLVVADHDYFDNLMTTLPDAYKLLSRQGLYGDFFNFYNCQLTLKLPGKGGQPVYVQIQNHPVGRCSPK